MLCAPFFNAFTDTIEQYSLLLNPLSLRHTIPYSQIPSYYCSMCMNVTLVQNNEGLYSYLLSKKTASLFAARRGRCLFLFLKVFIFFHSDRSTELCNLEGWNIYQSETEHYFYYVY